ncbi:hypothetical protein SASPL_137727 [Salvia splendens]|uniref:Uncharacterized protein n=1 Tax=Salvia splendens TaxID=180675 RepID=A0A8X8WTY8_SALSN|nr:hypothetical protein SASPL_137727 [Salvia splendens]
MAFSMTLSDKLKIFKSNNFDPQSYFHSNSGGTTEKEIRQLCMHLDRLKKASAEEMRKSVYANYESVIRREISDLEGELVSLKNLLSTRANIIHGIAAGVRTSPCRTELIMLERLFCSAFPHNPQLSVWLIRCKSTDN